MNDVILSIEVDQITNIFFENIMIRKSSQQNMIEDV